MDTTDRLHFHFSLSCIGEGHGTPLQCSCLENPSDRGAWWAAVYGVAQSRTGLKRLSSSSSSVCRSTLPSQLVVPSPSLAVSTSPFCTSASLFLPRKQIERVPPSGVCYTDQPRKGLGQSRHLMLISLPTFTHSLRTCSVPGGVQGA